MAIVPPEQAIHWPLMGVDIKSKVIETYESERILCMTREDVELDDETEPLFDARGIRIRIKCTPWDGITQVIEDHEFPDFESFHTVVGAVFPPEN